MSSQWDHCASRQSTCYIYIYTINFRFLQLLFFSLLKTQWYLTILDPLGFHDRSQIDKWYQGRINSVGFSHGPLHGHALTVLFIPSIVMAGKWVRYDLTRTRESSSWWRRIVGDDPVSSVDSMERLYCWLKTESR